MSHLDEGVVGRYPLPGSDHTAWKPAPPDLVSLFDRVVPADPAVERRKMFGYPCAFVGGNMVCGLYQDGVIATCGSGGDRADRRHHGEQQHEFAGRHQRTHERLEQSDYQCYRPFLFAGFAD